MMRMYVEEQPAEAYTWEISLLGASVEEPPLLHSRRSWPPIKPYMHAPPEPDFVERLKSTQEAPATGRYERVVLNYATKSLASMLWGWLH